MFPQPIPSATALLHAKIRKPTRAVHEKIPACGPLHAPERV
ncbi:hypothetical protein SM0020_04015, partial [Sinorhizobium meliloti CCNWSX0020]